jgi:hypothetical protein
VDPGGYTGHSLRRGAAQDAHDMGLPRDDIMMLGRWSSDAVDRYYNTIPTELGCSNSVARS